MIVPQTGIFYSQIQLLLRQPTLGLIMQKPLQLQVDAEAIYELLSHYYPQFQSHIQDQRLYVRIPIPLFHLLLLM